MLWMPLLASFGSFHLLPIEESFGFQDRAEHAKHTYEAGSCRGVSRMTCYSQRWATIILHSFLVIQCQKIEPQSKLSSHCLHTSLLPLSYQSTSWDYFDFQKVLEEVCRHIEVAKTTLKPGKVLNQFTQSKVETQKQSLTP